MIDFIDDNIHKTNVLVHCFAGVSRSSTAIIAYLMKKLNWELLKAFNYYLRIPSAQVKACLILHAMFMEGVSIITGQIKTRDHLENLLTYFDFFAASKGYSQRGLPNIFKVFFPLNPLLPDLPIIKATIMVSNIFFFP